MENFRVFSRLVPNKVPSRSKAPSRFATSWRFLALTFSAFFLALAGTTVIGVSSASAATQDTWTGLTATSATNPNNWSTATNWSGGAPSGTDILNFPVLSSTCNTSGTPSDTCYTSNNDISGLTPSQLSIETNDSSTAGVPGYNITGYPITLTPTTGGTGLVSTATVPSGTSFYPSTNQLALPIVLGANQNWSITGIGPTLEGGVTGSYGLNIALSPLSNGSQPILGSMTLEGTNEVGAVTIAGSNSSNTGTAASENGTLIIEPYSAGASTLNDTSGAGIQVTDAGLTVGDGTIGPLTTTGASVLIHNLC